MSINGLYDFTEKCSRMQEEPSVLVLETFRLKTQLGSEIVKTPPCFLCRRDQTRTILYEAFTLFSKEIFHQIDLILYIIPEVGISSPMDSPERRHAFPGIRGNLRSSSTRIDWIINTMHLH
jgi:hypothetical protein